ncbi:MAG: acylphosphatase [Bacteroidales bacterium]|nr:acylphosphatase [Bacteroidales bacterium]
MVHKNILIQGFVQGVGFRYSAVKAAHQFDIKGFVKNMQDGSVYIEAEGSESKVEEFIMWCHSGPPMAHIRSVSILDGPLMQFRHFKIAY